MELNWRTQRQIIIFVTYFLIIFIPVFYISYNLLSKNPSCFDGIQNAQEEGVDCNGSCQLRCDGTYTDIKVNFVRGMKVSENLYDIFALVENYNTQIYFPNIPYELDFYNEEGKLMGSSTGNISLLPQSRGVVFLPSVALLQYPKTLDLNLKNHKALRYNGKVEQNVTVENWQSQRGANNSLQVVAEVKNPTNVESKNIDVYVMLYDDTKTVYAVSATKINSLRGREKTGVTFTWGDIPSPRNVDFVVTVNE